MTLSPANAVRNRMKIEGNQDDRYKLATESFILLQKHVCVNTIRTHIRNKALDSCYIKESKGTQQDFSMLSYRTGLDTSSFRLSREQPT